MVLQDYVLIRWDHNDPVAGNQNIRGVAIAHGLCIHRRGPDRQASSTRNLAENF